MRPKIPTSELFIIKKFLLNAVMSISRDDISIVHHLVGWIDSNQNALQLPLGCKLVVEDLDSYEDLPLERAIKTIKQKSGKGFEAVWGRWKKKFHRHVNSIRPKLKSKTEKTASWIGQLCDLPTHEIEVLLFLGLYEKYKAVKQLCVAMTNGYAHHRTAKNGIDEDCLSQLIGLDQEENYDVDHLQIMKFGIVESRQGHIKLNRSIRKIFTSGIAQEDELKNLVLGENRVGTLELKEFEYLGNNVSTLTKLLKQHAEEKNKPLNLFFFGPPGTGKTEFAKALGTKVGKGVYFVGEHDEENKDVTREERVSALMLLGGIKDRSNSKILVVDEADEILSDIGANTNMLDKGSKIFLNRLLEKINTPIIWIVNDHEAIDAAVLRRMNYCLEFPKPPMEVRKTIIAKIANDNNVKIGRGEIEELAKYEASPAYFENAIRLSGNIDGDLKTTQQILENNLSASGAILIQIAANADFNPELSNANMDLLALRDRVKSCKTTKLTFCFSGQPGTGKSEYARYLAKELGYEILFKRYSDLSSMWVGGTEKNIANAFREARQKKAFLILDEADSLLQKRENANRSWEVTQVNEFLTQIENHDFPFAITTNAFDNLDTAAMRRFLFKIKFACMESAQIIAAFKFFFNEAAPNELLRTDGLTPADFALVRNQAAILGIADKHQLCEMLIEEISTRGVPRARIGF